MPLSDPLPSVYATPPTAARPRDTSGYDSDVFSSQASSPPFAQDDPLSSQGSAVGSNRGGASASDSGPEHSDTEFEERPPRRKATPRPKAARASPKSPPSTGKRKREKLPLNVIDPYAASGLDLVDGEKRLAKNNWGMRLHTEFPHKVGEEELYDNLTPLPQQFNFEDLPRIPGKLPVCWCKTRTKVSTMRMADDTVVRDRSLGEHCE